MQPARIISDAMVDQMFEGGRRDGRIFRNRSETRFSHVTDGLSNTLAMGEAHGGVLAGPPEAQSTWLWMSAPTLPASGTWMPGGGDRAAFGSFHTGVVQFVQADGSVRPIGTTIDATTWVSINGMRDGDVTGEL